eukprot:2471298-Prymnesium_polylepis.1
MPHRFQTDPSHYKSYRSTILPEFASYQTCDSRFNFLIPYETQHLANVSMPASAALDPFVPYAWHGIGTTDSFWDGCSDYADCE